MPEQQPVKGEKALRRMAAKALNQPSKGSEEEKDPLEEAQRFTKQMAASAIIESEVEKSKAGAEEAKAKAEEAKAKAERARSGAEQGSEGPFKVTGGVSLGNIDLQKDREEAREELERLKKEADDAARATGQENQQLRDKIHEQEIKMLQITFKAQMEALTKMIESNAPRKSFLEQYTEAMETAKALGMAQPSPGSSDLQTNLALKKLEFDQTLELRRLAREDKSEARKWQMELRRLDDEREARKVEEARQAKRDEMITNAPQLLGGAIARGIMESGGETPQPATGKTGHHIEAGAGEGGETRCPECGELVGIGPTARAAICPQCGLRIPIKRIKGKPTEVAEEEE